jgi:hypothetical protein
MKFLEFTEPAYSPQSWLEGLGILMDQNSCLVIGMVSGDSSYLQPGDAGRMGATRAGGVWGMVMVSESVFPYANSCYTPSRQQATHRPGNYYLQTDLDRGTRQRRVLAKRAVFFSRL